jgi:hypothetical protein
MSYLGNNYLKEFVIGGGLQTAEHKKSGGYRLDIAHTAGLNRAWWDYEKILEAPNGDGTNYAVFKLTGTDYYLFAVHMKNARSAKRGEVYCDLVAGKFLHVHIKIGGYSSAVTKYLHYLDHLDPSVKISTNYGSNAYTGLNKGVHLPTSNSEQPPMGFNYELYLKGKDLYMRVTSGSINQNVTVKNVTKGTSWQVFCNKSVGNDGGAINVGMEASLYEVNALGVVKQFDNRPAPVDPCAGVKNELANAQKALTTKDGEINTLNGTIGGLRTENNKQKELVAEKEHIIVVKDDELKALNIELEDIKKRLGKCELDKDTCNNSLNNIDELIASKDKEIGKLNGLFSTEKEKNRILQKKLEQSENNKKGMTIAELVQKIISFFKKK